jgi:hypothetical protein
MTRTWEQQIIFTAQNVLTQEDSPVGYALLQCIARYMDYHTYITLDVHTESTLAAGEEGLLAFQRSLQVRIMFFSTNIRLNQEI